MKRFRDWMDRPSTESVGEAMFAAVMGVLFIFGIFVLLCGRSR